MASLRGASCINFRFYFGYKFFGMNMLFGFKSSFDSGFRLYWVANFFLFSGGKSIGDMFYKNNCGTRKNVCSRT